MSRNITDFLFVRRLREFEDEAGALGVAGVEPDSASQELDDGLADGKSETVELHVFAHLAEGIFFVKYIAGGIVTTVAGSSLGDRRAAAPQDLHHRTATHR